MLTHGRAAGSRLGMSFKAEQLPRERQALAHEASGGRRPGARSGAAAAMAAEGAGAACRDPPAAGAAPAAVAATVAVAAADTSHTEAYLARRSRCGTVGRERRLPTSLGEHKSTGLLRLELSVSIALGCGRSGVQRCLEMKQQMSIVFILLCSSEITSTFLNISTDIVNAVG